MSWPSFYCEWLHFVFLPPCFRSIFPIHPSFRIIALAEPPVVGSTTQQWLGPEFLTMFLFHHMKPLVKSEEIQVIKEMVRGGLLQAGVHGCSPLKLPRSPRTIIRQFPDWSLVLCSFCASHYFNVCLSQASHLALGELWRCILQWGSTAHIKQNSLKVGSQHTSSVQ